MELFELTHVFYRDKDEMIYSPKSLGFFGSLEKVEQAIREYKIKPGFCENPEAFSVRRRKISGKTLKKHFMK